MDQLKVLQLYLATKAHFTSSYDIFKFNGKIRNADISTLHSNKARLVLVERLAKRFKKPADLMGFLIPQYVYSSGGSLYNAIESDENYNRWQKFRTAPEYNLISDLSDHDLTILEGDDPKILKLLKRGDIKIESVIALQKMFNWIIPGKDYFLDHPTCVIINKSIRFINFDEVKVREELGYAKT